MQIYYNITERFCQPFLRKSIIVNFRFLMLHFCELKDSKKFHPFSPSIFLLYGNQILRYGPESPPPSSRRSTARRLQSSRLKRLPHQSKMAAGIDSHFIQHIKSRFDYFATVSFRAAPALKAGTLVAGIFMGFLVRGLMPLRAALSLVSKVPKPIS